MGASDVADTGGGCGGGVGGAGQGGRGATGGGHFVVELCTSQEDDRWKEVSVCHTRVNRHFAERCGVEKRIVCTLGKGDWVGALSQSVCEAGE